jgi:ketosteroid isomerase-like protein
VYRRMNPGAKKILALALGHACLWCLGVSAQGQQAAQPAEKASPAPPELREMQAVEDHWSDAVTKRDQYAMELVLAPQFIGISASGDVTTRNQQIAGLFVKGTGPDSLEQKVISVRFVGEVAIVNGTYVMSWKTEKGPFQEKGIFSHVFEHVHNNWLCLNSQRTVVAEDVKRAVQEKPKSTKRSDAALPMHIPLVYKGPESTQPAPPPGSGTPAP